MFEALALAFAAGAAASMANLCMRRSVDVGGNTHGYLLVQLLIAALLSTWSHPIRHHSYAIDPVTAALGLAAGLCTAAVMIFLGRSLAKGPAGLSIAFVNASTVVPALLMSWILGPSFGFVFNTFHWLGSLLIVVGLFWASRTSLKVSDKLGWFRAIGIVFVSHVLLLMLMQYRALLLKQETPLQPPLVPLHLSESTSHWFLPMKLAIAWLIQLLVFWRSSGGQLRRQELLYGAVGGVANGLAAVFLLHSTLCANSGSNPLIYPLYSVTNVFICSLWSWALYRERVNWPAMTLAGMGVVLGACA